MSTFPMANYNCTPADELDEMGIDNVGVGEDPFPADLSAEDCIVPPVQLSDGPIGAVVVGFDNLISLPKLIKVDTHVPDSGPQI